MKRLIYIASAFAVCAACQKDDVQQPAHNPGVAPSELYAVIEDGEPSTKIHLGEYEGRYRVLWDGYNDATAVFAGIDKSSVYRVKGATANTPAATLYLQDGKAAASETSISAIAAYYPYPSSGAVGGMQVTENEDGSYTFPGSFSDSQTYLEGSFPNRGFPLVAVSEGTDDHSLNFKNAAGALCVNVKGGAKVKSITLKSNESGKVICGNADITAANTDIAGNVPSYEFTGGKQTLTLNCTPAVQTSADEATPFYMGVAPQTFPEGFTVTLNDVDFTWTVRTDKTQTINRSKVLNMPAVTFPLKEFDLSKPSSTGSGAVYDSDTQVLQFTGTSNRYVEFSVSDVNLSDCEQIGLITDDCNCCLKLEFYAKGKYSTASYTWTWYSPGVQTEYYKKVTALPTDLKTVFEEQDIDRIRIGLNTNVSVDGVPTIHLSRLVLY